TTSPASWPSWRSPAGPRRPRTWPGTRRCRVATDGGRARLRQGGAIASPSMASLDPVLLRWVVGTAAPGAEVTEVRGLRDGGSPWLVRLTRHGTARSVV